MLLETRGGILTIAERLARYVRSLRYQRVPPDVVHEVERRILDSLGCAFGAWSAKPCRIARRMAEAVQIPSGASLWGTRCKTLPELAAFANGALVRYLDFNDTYLAKEPAHPSDNISAALAVGEAAHASGRSVILAILAAYEIQCRLCDAAALRPRGWDHVTYGPFSSALAAAMILRLSQASTVQAVNLAGVANIALRQTRVGDMSMWKACAFSNAARNGVFSASLAAQGMTGPSPIFEGEKGFINQVSGPLELSRFGGEERPFDIAQGERHKGASHEQSSFKIMDTYIKHYPVEYHAQSAVEAALLVREELIEREGAQFLSAITDIEIGSYDVAIEIIGRDPEKWRPRTRETADHSFPYCVAVALKDGSVAVRSFNAKRLADPALMELMQKVRVMRYEEFQNCYPQTMPTRVTVRTARGKQYGKQVDVPLGHPKQPMSDREVEEKFRGLAAGVLDRARAEKLIDMIWKFDRLKDVAALMPLMRVSRHA
jgi:2-methylcitrate dehydratase